MKKETTKNARKTILLLFSFIFFLLSSANNVSALTCAVRAGVCNAGETPLLRMQATNNSHAGFVGSSAYNNIICCSEAGVTIGTSCAVGPLWNSFDVFLELQALDNSHVEEKTFSNYVNNACISVNTGYISCSYETGNCPAGSECLASISASRNAHIGDCGSYATKVCCGIGAGGGLVPCGRHIDDPTTAILENTPCTLCHFFLLVKRIVDFLFIDIALPLLALGVIALGVSLIASRGNPERLAKGKHFFKEFGVGVAIVIGSWIIIETIIGGVVSGARPWSNWMTLSCPVAPCDDATSDPSDDETPPVCETANGEDSQNCPTDCPCDFNDSCDPVIERIGLGNPEACPDCAVCGNGIVDAGEYCDPGPPLVIRGLNPANGCVIFGYKSGDLNCTQDCQIDLSDCSR